MSDIPLSKGFCLKRKSDGAILIVSSLFRGFGRNGNKCVPNVIKIRLDGALKSRSSELYELRKLDKRDFIPLGFMKQIKINNMWVDVFDLNGKTTTLSEVLYG